MVLQLLITARDTASDVVDRVRAETPQWTGTLTLADGRTFNARFREEGLIAEPVYHQTHSAALDSLPYTFTLKLQTV